jgi:ribosome-binding protein aMBF1 (putative translation factor)
LRISYRSLLLRGEPILMTTVVEANPVAAEVAAPQKLVPLKRKPKAKKAKSPKAKKSRGKTPRLAKSSKKTAAREKKPATKTTESTGKPRGRGIRKDGKPRRSPGTNPAASKETAAYGKKVAAARTKKELTQKQLADKMGISQPGLANIERGVVGASDDMKAKIKKAIGVAA